jgi:hypothetical protein
MKPQNRPSPWILQLRNTHVMISTESIKQNDQSLPENGVNRGQFDIAPFVTSLPSSAERAPTFEHKKANRKMYDQGKLT